MSAIFPGLSYRQMYRKFKKNGSRSFSACNALNLFSRILSETLAYNSFFFFSEQPFYGNYTTLDSHTNTVILTRLPTRQDGVENRNKGYCKFGC